MYNIVITSARARLPYIPSMYLQSESFDHFLLEAAGSVITSAAAAAAHYAAKKKRQVHRVGFAHHRQRISMTEVFT